jgi:hypothetical protein
MKDILYRYKGVLVRFSQLVVFFNKRVKESQACALLVVPLALQSTQTQK